MSLKVAAMPVTVRAHANIALVKYWGKRPGPGNLPAVGSVSVTLDALWTETRIVRAAGALGDHVVGLGDAAAARALAYVRDMRALALADGCDARAPLRLETHNNFPTAAGLASSASGFAALAVALDAAWGWRRSPEALSALARRGSGSAARSLFGGFVTMPLPADAAAEVVAAPLLPADAWPLGILVAVVDRAPKAHGSTAGMHATESTSAYWPAWVSSHPADLKLALAAIAARDFAALAEVTEASCLKMHGAMLAARPGLVYWQPATLAAIHAVRALRAEGVPACFTIDAGPQVKVLCEPAAAEAVRRRLADVPGVVDVLSSGLGPGAHVCDTWA